MLVIDVETTGITEDSLGTMVGVGLYSSNAGRGLYYKYPEEAKDIAAVLAKDWPCYLFHNASYDIEVLANHGFHLKDSIPIRDTKLMAFLADPDQELGLKPLATKYLGRAFLQCYEDLMADLQSKKLKKSEMAQGDPVLLSEYCLEDCRNTYAIYKVLSERIKKTISGQKKLGKPFTVADYYKDELLPVEKLLPKISKRGIRLDIAQINVTIKETQDQIDDCLNVLEGLAAPYTKPITDILYNKELSKRKTEKGKERVVYPKFNFQAVQQVAELFFVRLGLKKLVKVPKTPTGKLQLNEGIIKECLGLVEDDTIKTLLQEYLNYKGFCKYLSTYLEGFLEKSEDGRIYPQYMQVSSGKFESSGGGTRTGRLSCRNPNLQNLPRDSNIKKFLIPDSKDKVFFYADYSQIELRLAAALSGDRKMVHAYQNNIDLHIQTADAIISKMKDKLTPKAFRNVGKTCNFLLIYGGSWRKLQMFVKDSTGLALSDDEAKEARGNFFKYYSDYNSWLSSCKQNLYSCRAAFTHYGLVRRLPDLKYNEGLDYRSRSYKGPYGHELAELLEKKSTSSSLYDLASKLVSHSINKGYNTPIQGTAASVMKRALLKLDEAGYDIVTTVHDSVTIQLSKADVPSSIPHIVGILEGNKDFTVPLLCEYKILNSLSEEDIAYETK